MADLAENARRKAQGKKPAVISPLALEAVRRIDALFEESSERSTVKALKGARRSARSLVRRWWPIWRLGCASSARKLSRGNDVAKAMDYMLMRWTAFTRFLDDGRICMSNNAAERGVRGIALGRKSWLFCGSDRGGERAAVDVQPDRYGQNERYRSASVARRRSRSHRRASRPKIGSSSCPGIGASSTSGTVRRPDKLHRASDAAAVFTGC